MIQLACPNCRALLDGPNDSDATCGECGERYPIVDGIHRFLPTSRLAHFESFLRDYTAVRLAEGRGTADVEYFQRLPEPTAGGPIEWQWTIRRHTWATVRDRVLPKLGDGLVVIDVGAGVGWLSNRLHELGHSPHAVDLTVDDDDGLGAARHYGPPWPRYQAEMDALPFADAQADVVVFNASLHYSTDYVRTIGEARRVLQAGRGRGDHGLTDLRSRRRGPADGRRASRRLRTSLRDALRQRRLDRVPDRRDARRHRRTARDPMGSSPHVVRLAVGAAAVEGARCKRRRQPSRFVVLVGQV